MNVLIVDDHAMVRQEIRGILENHEDMQVIGEASDGREAVRLADCLLPGIVVMDINMPKMNGIEATREITTRHPEIIVIGLSVNANEQIHQAMISAGAARFLTKEAAVDWLYEAIRAALKDRE